MLSRKYFEVRKISICSVVLYSTILFYLVITAYASLVFQQFKVADVFSVSLVFLTLLIVLAGIFSRDFFSQKIELTRVNILFSILICSFLVFVFSSYIIFIDYYPTFPLYDVDLGLPLHPDSSFHVSVIQSIINFGYPSTAQHGQPLLVYYVLSHYVDALIVVISGLEVFDSYGLFFVFKAFLLLVSVVFFIARVIESRNGAPWSFLISVFLFLPVMITPWAGIGSHGLWFPTLLLIFSSPNVFRILTKPSRNSLKEYLILILIVTLISLGKLSLGFVYASFIGFYLLFKDFKDFKIYASGIVLFLFFLSIQSFFRISDSSSNFSWQSFDALKGMINYSFNAMFPVLGTVLFTIFSFFVLTVTYKSENRNEKTAFLASICSLFAIVMVFMLYKGLILPAVWYFQFGLSSVLLLFLYQSFFVCLKSECTGFSSAGRDRENKLKASLVMIVVIICMAFYFPKFNYFNTGYFYSNKKLGWHSLNDVPFLNLNKSVFDNDRLSLNKVIKNPLKNHIPIDLERPVFKFRQKIFSILAEYGVNKAEARLFIPRRVYDGEFKQFKIKSWARGLLIYGVTGVPLIYGIQQYKKDYGLADYSKQLSWVNLSDSDLERKCKQHPAKLIISVESIVYNKINVFNCKAREQ